MKCPNYCFQIMSGARNIDLWSFWIKEKVSCRDDHEAVGDTCGM